ncbi:MAG: S41 family peptidase, partial [Muribaculaceae bacterium]
MRKGILSLIVLGLAIVVAGNVSGQTQIKKLLNAHFAISQFYVDSVNNDKLVEDAIKGMLDKLDPHSTYSNPTETKELEEPLQGNFSGIGIQFNMKEDTLYVIQTIVGGPSERVGI